MKQTAVECYNKEISKLFNQFQDGEISNNMFHVQRLVALTKAKEMEKNQRQLDTNFGYVQGYDDGAEGLEPMKPELMEPESLTFKSE